MDSSNSMIWILALFTLVAVVVIAIWQRKSAAKAKDEHAHSAMTAKAPEQRKSDGAEPGTKAH